jgi:D-3-phosphoglycerate dehydrogenase
VSVKVLVSDKLAPVGLAILEAAQGLEVTSLPGLSPSELLDVIGEYDGLVIRSGTRVTAELIERAERLRVIGRAGIGVDNVDVEAASKRGVVVMNTPGGNNVTTAEHAISMMLAVARHIPQANASLRAGKWERSAFVGTEVSGKTLGVVGVGNIGSIVADRAKGLTMHVIAFDPFLTPDAAARLGIELVSLEELYARSDFISVHTPLTQETRGLIGRNSFTRMKKGVRVVNCARGGIVDEAALLDALESGQVAGAALDVFASEPPAPDSALIAHPAVVATPHLGASTGEAQLNVAIAVAEQVRDFLLADEVRNAINMPSVSQEAAGALAPYILLAERLGKFQSQLSDGAPSEITVEFRGEVADLDCRPLTSAVLKGLLSGVLDVPVNAVNAPYLAKERGVKVVEMRDQDATSFASSIRVTFNGGGGADLIEGAVFDGHIVRVVRFNDFFLETVPEGNILVLHNRDVPGVVGSVGCFLGEQGVNIGGFVLGRVGGEAVSFVHMDSPLAPEQLESLRQVAGITSAQMVSL